MKYLVIILSLITIALWIRIGDLKLTDEFFDKKIESLEDKYKSTEIYQRIIDEAKLHQELKDKYNNLITNCPNYGLGQTTNDCLEYVELMGKHLKKEVLLNIDAESYLRKQPDISELKKAQNELKKIREGILVPVKLFTFLAVALALYMIYNFFTKKSSKELKKEGS